MLDQGLQTGVPEQKSTGVPLFSKGQAEAGAAASSTGRKTGKEGEHELDTVGPALPALPDLFAALSVIPMPQQSSSIPKLSAETVAAGPSEGSSSVQSFETGKVTRAQELAGAAVQTPLLPGDGTSIVPIQNGIQNQNARGATPSPDASPSSQQVVASATPASTPSYFPSAASSTPVLPAPVLSTSPLSPASPSVQPAVTKSGSKQAPSTDATSTPSPVVPGLPPINISPTLNVPSLLVQNPLVPSLSVPQAATTPALKLTGTTLNANRSSQSADSKLKQPGSNSEPSSSVPSESRSAPVHTFGTALTVEPSTSVVADANAPSSPAITTENAILFAPGAGANGHAFTDVSTTGQTSADQPAASAANVAAQAAAIAAPSINTAKVLETIHGTELRMGLHSTEFGSISIATTVSPGGIAAQIALDHGALGKALATHLTSMEEKLGSSFGLPAKVELRDGMASGLQGNGAGTASGGENSRGNAKQHWTARGDDSSTRVGEGFSGSALAAESRADVSSTVRLSVQA